MNKTEFWLMNNPAFDKELEQLGFETVKADELSRVHMFWKVLQKSK